MPDITMCDGKGCEVRDRCYRHTATPNEEWQSYMTAPTERPCPLYRPDCRKTSEVMDEIWRDWHQFQQDNGIEKEE